METLVKEIGNRESGTDSELRAAKRIKGWFEEVGLANVRMEQFDVVTSRVLKEEAVLPDGSQLDCSAVGNSFSTSPEGVEGEVMVVESTSPEVLRGTKGKIAAINVRLNKKTFSRVVRAEPAALIFPSVTPLAPTIYRSIPAEWTEKEGVPAVAISHDNLLSVIKGPKRLKILTEIERFTAKSQNVVGEVPGEIEDEDILVGGHYDTVRNILGAHDNAAGTAIVLELARIFAGEKLNRTLRFAAFGSEELGLRGSLYYAEKERNVKNLRFYLNLDVHGILLGTQIAHVLGPEDLKALIRLLALELGIAVEVSSEFGRGGSDHMPLALYAVPSVQLARSGGAAQVMHTVLEDLRWCSSEAFAPVGKLSQTLLTRLLNAAEFPFEKEIPPEIAKKLEKRFELWGIKRKPKKERV
jgi:aminopeptidase YwaD